MCYTLNTKQDSLTLSNLLMNIITTTTTHRDKGSMLKWSYTMYRISIVPILKINAWVQTVNRALIEHKQSTGKFNWNSQLTLSLSLSLSLSLLLTHVLTQLVAWEGIVMSNICQYLCWKGTLINEFSVYKSFNLSLALPSLSSGLLDCCSFEISLPNINLLMVVPFPQLLMCIE